MYISDAEYISLVTANSRQDAHVTGTITTNTNRVIEVNDETLIQDTLKITNQSLNNTSFNLGTVYAAQLSMTITTSIELYTLHCGTVELTYHIGKYDVPLGVYEITDATRVRDRVNITACDAMLKFDEAITDDAVGLAQDLLQYVCNECDVPLGMEEEEIRALPNGDLTFAVLQERVQTYRDAISYIASVTCTFATIDRDGKLVLRRYASDNSMDIDNNTRLTDAEFSDYEVKFSGVYARFVAEQNYYPYSKIDKSVKNGLYLSLGDVPIVQGTSDFKQIVINNIWNAVKDIRYTPFSAKIKPNPALDLGDLVYQTNINNKNNVNAIGYVQYFEWNYRKPMILKATGDNPKLASVKAKQSRELANLEASVAGNEIKVRTYTNVSKIAADTSEEKIITLSFATTSEAKAIFAASVPYELDLDGNVIFSFYIDNVLQEQRTVTRYDLAGKDFATLFSVLEVGAGERKTVAVTVKTEYVASDKRKSDAEQSTLVNFKNAVENMLASGSVSSVTYDTVQPDTTPPKLNIEANSIIACVYGQGIAGGEAPWDGTLEFTESIQPIDITVPTVTVNKFTDSVTTAQQTPDKSGLHDVFSMIDIDVPDVIVSDIDFVNYLADKAGVILTDKDGNKLSERGKDGK